MLSVNVSDTISISEDIAAGLEALAAAVSSAVAVADSPGAVLACLVSVSETPSVADTPSILAVFLVSPSEAISVGESVLSEVSTPVISVQEAVELEEGYGLQGFLEGTLEYAGDDSLGTIYHETKKHPHLVRFYMAIENPRYLWKGRVSGYRGQSTDEPDEDMTITFTDGANQGTFDVDDFMPDLTCWIGSEDESYDKGKCRVRTVGGSTLTVSADMSCFWEDGDYITIVDLHEIWPRPHKTEVSEDGETLSLWKDTDLEYTERKELPVPIIGPPACEFLDAVTGEVTVQFYGDQSYVVQPDSGSYESLGWTNQGVTSYSWWFEGGDPETSSDANPAVTYDTAGRYKVRLEVTRTGVGSEKGFRNVFIFERTGANAPITEFQDLKIKGSLSAKGWQASFRVFGTIADVDEFPPDAQVVVFAEQTFDGSDKESTYGYPGRENILMVGWLSEGALNIGSAGRVDMQMTMEGLQNYLETKQNNPAYFTMVDDDAHEWQYFDHDASDPLTYRKAMYHYLRWHWTVNRFTDVFIADDHNNYRPGAIFPEGDVGSAIERMVQDHQGRWGVDKGGALHLYTWPNTLPVTGAGLAWREAHQIIAVWNEDDWKAMRIVPRTRDKVGQVKVEGVASAENGWYGAVFANVPGNVRGFSGPATVISNQNVGSDDQAEELAKAIFCEESRNIESVSLDLCGNYSLVDIAPPSRIEVSYRPGFSVRDINWTLKKFWVVGCDLACNVQNGYIETTKVELFPETEPYGRAYSDVTGIGFVNRSNPKVASSQHAFADYVSKSNQPNETILPALMGDGAGHVSSDVPGKTIVRIFGDPNKIVEAENREFKEIDGRPVWVEFADGHTWHSRRGQHTYQIVGVRRTTTEDDDDDSARSYQTHRGIMSNMDELAVDDTASQFLPVEGEGMKLMEIWARVSLAPSGADLVISLTRNGASVGSVTIGDGQLRGSYTLSSPVDLDVGDYLDFSVTQVGSSSPGTNLVVTAVCREYGV